MSESEGLSTLANWMIAHGYATGHGDTAEDLLSELVAQVSGGDGMVRVPREPSEAMQEAVAWLMARGYVEMAEDPSSQYVNVLRRPGEDDDEEGEP